MGNRPVKIAFIVGGGRFFGAELPLGGAASYLKAAARSLPRDRFDPTFIFLFDGPTVGEFEALGFSCRVARRLFRGDPTLPFRLARILSRERPDLAVTAVSNANLYGRLAAKMAGVPGIATVIMDYMRGIMAETKYRPFLEKLGLVQERLLWRLCTRIIAPSNPLRNYLVREWNLPPERVVVIPGAVDSDRPPCDESRIREARAAAGVEPGRFLAGTMARLAPVKNIPMLLRAARRVEDEAPGEVRFAVAGDGPQRPALEAQARAMNLGAVVAFLGWRRDAEAFTAAADLHLLTSYSESQGISLLEAMAAGKPVVATGVGGVVEVVEDGVTGFLVDPDDDEALAQHILELKRDPELARRMGEAGRRRIRERFSLEQVRRGFEALAAPWAGRAPDS